MQSIRSVLFTAVAITVTLVAFVFTASLALALAVVAIGSAIAAKLNRRPAHVHARTNPTGAERQMRIWNDGRGTIIDL
ncbi:hypothetical protein [Ensifer aridi]|uniref:hypothetical protein n=1 Tax=Ensifer aridi TaxID=1708715 RepID=UPI000A111D76|nr:hypothetical protein [Ensifer aridi]